ncbi:glycine cleavage system aminomethyltransferase GcvT [Paenibacillus sp. JCM 10914]|uniref:glycine cleavage system aminomethyltransferase GcvT n=1 Tax=Paenibacillus sp. JCM 10914 TaxID=1236974 RepID=UPI0003CC35BD|nr:glycine cleavage system aminomethyltransferase GcvT [Paenibacillus sp. JCM 10914]GAE08365.1 putative CDP-glycerol [Paenibacillus sp. JCM 10914]
MSSLQRTPLYPLYADFPSARCINFGGWDLPVQFTGIVQEHYAVRKQAGLFDVSHMGEFIVTGTDAESFIQRMTTNDVTKLQSGQAQYTLMCYENGGTIDDLLVYKLANEQYMLVVNASNIDKDLEWLQQHLAGDVSIQNVSAETALIALQGPAAMAILSAVTPENLHELPSFHFIQQAQVCGSAALLSRTGYTGEDGFEIYCSAEDAAAIWKGLLAVGAPHGLVPTGLGARDTLRFEAKLPLYGQELSSTISPLEASLGFFVKLDKGDFIGRDALQKQKTDGVPRKLVGIELIDRGIPRSHYTVHNEAGATIGEVTSGTQSPSLKRNLGLALIETSYAALDTEVWVEIRGKQLKAIVVKTPFYKRGAALT